MSIAKNPLLQETQPFNPQSRTKKKKKESREKEKRKKHRHPLYPTTPFPPPALFPFGTLNTQ